MKRLFVLFLLFYSCTLEANSVENSEGYTIVRKSMDMWRGQESSISSLTMKVIRPNRIESMSLKAWSKGDSKSVSKFVAPAKYDGQAILVLGDSMWTYSPKSRRSIKISSSMKSKPWMGSDMSYDDIAVSLESLLQYTYGLTKSTKDGEAIYIVEAIPLRNAPIVWGKEVIYIRVIDNAMLAKEFYDQGGKMIRRFDALSIGYYKNDKSKPIMKHMRVTNLEKDGYFTEFIIDDTQFNVEINDAIFSLANLERS